MTYELITKDKLILMMGSFMDTFQDEISDTINRIKFVFIFYKDKSFIKYTLFSNSIQVISPELVKKLHTSLRKVSDTVELSDDNRYYEHTILWSSILNGRHNFIHYDSCSKEEIL
uniref:Uncharacterized protein n=1 Tax=viral metagenome TaxID=1070528 RepID=A0A6C0AZA4_9ZZZZ